MNKFGRFCTLFLAMSFALTNSMAEPVNATPDDVIPVKAPTRLDTAQTTPATPPIVSIPEQKKPEGRLWNLQDADILSVINEVALETGKNFIIDPRVTGKITLISSKPINPNEVYDIFLSVLSLLGYSAIPSGDVIKIVPNMESSEYATRVASRKNPGQGDEVVVRVIPLENVTANQLIPVIRPLLPQWSNITAYTPGNVLILVGRASNLERILTIINNIDRTADNTIEIVPLRQASAAQLVTVLNNLQNAARASGDTSQVSIAADERSNSILLSGNKTARLRTRTLISQLDAPSSGAQGNTEVIYLRYLIAKNFAPILGKIAQNLMGKDGGKDGAPSAPASNTAQASGGPTGAPKGPENMTNIQAEPSTNAIIITAPPAMMRALRSVVSKLDIRPAQVLVEGILVEIAEADLKNLGIQWGARVTPTTIQPPAPFAQFGEGVVGIIPGQQIQAVLSALQTNNNINILSTPSIVVLDNHKASLDIGQDVPVQTGSYATNTSVGNGNPFTTTGYRKVALVLEVTPQINLGNSVRMLVKIKNDTLQNPTNPGITPLINTSQISNSVLVESCDILVIGGLIRTSITEEIDKIPILGDIPILGYAFQHKIRQLQKRNLVVFLKPVIMHNNEDADILTNHKYETARNAQMNWPRDLSNPGKQKAENILPLWKNNVDLPKPFES
jgi:general secretion pathway protein D